MGRPTKLTPELQEKIVTHIKNGNYIDDSCMAVGISDECYYNWLRLAEAYDNGNGDRIEEHSVYSDFSAAVKRAQAEAITAIVAEVRDHVPKEWAAGITILERRFPAKWGRKEAIAIDVRDTRQQQVLTELFKEVLELKEQKQLPVGKDAQGTSQD